MFRHVFEVTEAAKLHEMAGDSGPAPQRGVRWLRAGRIYNRCGRTRRLAPNLL